MDLNNQKIKNERTKRGQAAMEYLMTYGWAILVIFIVLAILAFYLPQLIKVPEQCTFSPVGFTCGESKPSLYVKDATNQVFLGLRVYNQLGQNVVIKKVICTTSAPGDVEESDGEDITDITLANGKSMDFIDSPCWKNKFGGSRTVLSENSDFRGSFFLWYNYEDDVPTGVLRKAQATLSGSVAKG